MARTRLTRDGVAFALFGTALLAVGWVSGNNLLLLVVAALLALVLVEPALAHANLRGLSVRRELPDEVFAGRVARGALRITRSGRWPSWGLWVGEQGEGGVAVSLDRARPGDTRVPVSWRWTQRGFHELTGLEVRSSWPFGLVERRRPLPLPAIVCVWPAPGVPPESREDVGDRDLSRTVEPDDLDDLRPYRPGDRLRDVHWPTSARVGSPMVVVRRGHAAAPVWVEVAPGSDDWEDRIGEAAGAVLDAVAARRPVGLRVPGGVHPPRVGPETRRRLLTVLAALPRGQA